MSIQNEISDLKKALKEVQKELMVLSGKEKAPLLEAHDRVIIEFKAQMDEKIKEVETHIKEKKAAIDAFFEATAEIESLKVRIKQLETELEEIKKPKEPEAPKP